MHIPVFLEEVIRIFDPKPGQTYLDATVNGGGHATAILEKMGGKGKVVGIDWDCELIEKLQGKNIPNLTLICENYARITSVGRQHNLDQVSGILFDLGFSSYQLEESGRGFSFLKHEALDMRYHQSGGGITASDIVNTWSKDAIETLLREYGEERYSRRIAGGIVAARADRAITRTDELSEIIRRSVGRHGVAAKIHPATRTFQALRIAVNKEFENMAQGFEGAAQLLSPGGKMIVISFHSLEDRIAKEFFKTKSADGVLKIITPKPLKPAVAEIYKNPRARSAKLRAAERL